MEHRITETNRLLERIETYLRLSGMTPSRFGRDVMGDPGLVRTLRERRKLRSATARRISLHLDALEAGLKPDG